MSNSQWHEDQSIGERALREHKREQETPHADNAKLRVRRSAGGARGRRARVTARHGGGGVMNAEREAEIRETIRLMRARLAEFNVTQPATRLSLAMAEDLLAALNEAREALEEQEADMHARIRAGYDRTVADAWRKKVEEVENERNARAREVDKLRAERRQLRRRLVECRPWVGVCPLEPARINEMIACRDLAKDTLEEVPE